MVDENLTDEQQADRIRQWLRDNGLFVFGGIGLGVAALFGWDQWQSYETQHAEEASGIYEELVGKIQVNNQGEANALLAELISDYSGSPYIDQARLRLTKLSLDRSAFDVAASYLESIIAESSNDEILHIARIRLARIRLQQEQYDAALAALERADMGSAFYAQVNDVRGDIYFVMNRIDEALAAYEAALMDTRQPPSIDRAYVQVKRNSLDVNANESVIRTETGIDTLGGTDDASGATE
jgi:predicted negative regulator of RcsB-dependent stress response